MSHQSNPDKRKYQNNINNNNKNDNNNFLTVLSPEEQIQQKNQFMMKHQFGMSQNTSNWCKNIKLKY